MTEKVHRSEIHVPANVWERLVRLKAQKEGTGEAFVYKDFINDAIFEKLEREESNIPEIRCYDCNRTLEVNLNPSRQYVEARPCHCLIDKLEDISDKMIDAALEVADKNCVKIPFKSSAMREGIMRDILKAALKEKEATVNETTQK